MFLPAPLEQRILFALIELSFKLLEELDDWSKDSLQVSARYMGLGIKGLQEDGIRNHSLRIRDHGLGIGISTVFHRIRDQTDS